LASEERLRELEEKYEDYKVYDNSGEKIGKVDDLFIDETDREEYIGVKMGFFGMKSTLIPMEIVRVNERDRTIEVSESKDHVKDAPNFDDDEDITPEYEERIRRHFGLESPGPSSTHASYDAYSGGAAAGEDRDRRPDDERDAGSGEYRDLEEEQRSDVEGPAEDAQTGERAPRERETREMPVSRQTEETETFEEGGRTKVRRRIIREEVVEEDPDQPTG
jgi:sporulation protein YlmC with PRC-barrel domain